MLSALQLVPTPVNKATAYKTMEKEIRAAGTIFTVQRVVAYYLCLTLPDMKKE